MLGPNPDYGSGVFRRRLRLVVSTRRIDVDLEDSNHAFRLTLRHDGERIMVVEPDYVRHPFTTCPESRRFLSRLAGRPLAGTDARRVIETREACTHLMDMTSMALAHWHEDGLRRLYDLAVEDERDDRTLARISCDGAPVHEWVVVRHAIVEPHDLAARPVMKGFHGWASVTFAGMAFEAAMALQRGYFVAQARRFTTDPERDHPAIGDGMPDGVCYSYSRPAVQRALRIAGSKREFGSNPEGLLTFRR